MTVKTTGCEKSQRQDLAAFYHEFQLQEKHIHLSFAVQIYLLKHTQTRHTHTHTHTQSFPCFSSFPLMGVTLNLILDAVG